MRRLNFGWFGGLLLFALVVVRPVVYPQFTINAGLLTVASIACLYVYSRFQEESALILGCILAFLGFLIRKEEFLMIALASAPLFLSKDLLFNRRFFGWLLGLFLSISVAYAIDLYAYSGSEWKVFNELRPSLVSILDFGGGGHLRTRPDIFLKHGFSGNDVDLVNNWFFDDPAIANPDLLKLFLKELGPLSTQENALKKGLIGLKAFWSVELIPMLSVGLLLILMRPSWRVIGCWILCITGVFLIGLSGRPGVIRVYVPIVSLMAIAPLLARDFSNVTRRITILALLIASSYSSWRILNVARGNKSAIESTRQG
ncbi:MAG: hypothetical protein EOP04_32505, partial [Proteobacteria bacterium]